MREALLVFGTAIIQTSYTVQDGNRAAQDIELTHHIKQMREHLTYADALVSIINELLEKGTESCWVTTLRMDVNDFKSEADLPAVGGYLHIACYAPSNYVLVLAEFTERPVGRAGFAQLDWQPIVCHDSCWRDGVREVIKESFDQVMQKALDQFGRAAADLNPHFHIATFFKADAAATLELGLRKNERFGRLTIKNISA